MPAPDRLQTTSNQELLNKLRNIESRLSDLNDLQLINKLDIINLKNQLDTIKLSGGVPMPSPEPEPQHPAPQPTESEYLVCEKCETVLPKSAKFCKKCGKKVKQ